VPDLIETDCLLFTEAVAREAGKVLFQTAQNGTNPPFVPTDQRVKSSQFRYVIISADLDAWIE